MYVALPIRILQPFKIHILLLKLFDGNILLRDAVLGGPDRGLPAFADHFYHLESILKSIECAKVRLRIAHLKLILLFLLKFLLLQFLFFLLRFHVRSADEGECRARYQPLFDRVHQRAVDVFLGCLAI